MNTLVITALFLIAISIINFIRLRLIPLKNRFRIVQQTKNGENIFIVEKRVYRFLFLYWWDGRQSTDCCYICYGKFNNKDKAINCINELISEMQPTTRKIIKID